MRTPDLAVIAFASLASSARLKKSSPLLALAAGFAGPTGLLTALPLRTVVTRGAAACTPSPKARLLYPCGILGQGQGPGTGPGPGPGPGEEPTDLARQREGLVRALFNHNDFVAIR